MSNGDNSWISIQGAREHNLKNINVNIPLGKLTVVTGPSGSGKTSLAMHTLYAEGQRRYMETFSPYVRQFMDRMDKPDVDAIDNILPSIALQQRNSIRTSRSTVGTMTGLNDYWKFVFARLSVGHDPQTGHIVKPATPESIWQDLISNQVSTALVCFKLNRPEQVTGEEFKQDLAAQGYLRAFIDGNAVRLDDPDVELGEQVWIIQDRLQINDDQHQRGLEALEAAIKFGRDRVRITTRSDDDTWSNIRDYRSDWYPLQEPRPGLFSFNSPLGACPKCRGYGRIITIDYARCVYPQLSIKDGALHIFETENGQECKRDLLRANKKRSNPIRLNVPWKNLDQWERDWVMNGDPGGDWDSLWQEGKWYGVKGYFDYLESRTHKMHIRVYLSRFRVYTECPACHGKRLRPEALLFTIDGKTLPDLFVMPMSELLPWVDKNVVPYSAEDAGLKHAVQELRSRLAYLNEVGLGYLCSDRTTRTLSGGEIERVSLTTCLGASLTDTLFVLDEPTVGLHPRDTSRLMDAMNRLKNRGNTLVVVEHEESVMRGADYLIDMGPASGKEGGEVVFAGRPDEMSQQDLSLTGLYLHGERSIPVPDKRRKPKKWLSISGATRNNLNDLSVKVPLGVFACLTGVSGSGKSTLAHDVIYLHSLVQQGITCEETPAQVRQIKGWESISEVLLVDQSPIVRTPRSTPAVYAGVFDEIRALFCATEAAKSRQLKPGFFSFNSGEGRCPRCAGMGSEKIEMQFLSDIFITCPLCHGLRYGQEALQIFYRDKNIAQVLQMTITESIDWFGSESDAKTKKILSKLNVLKQVGLGHLGLGQALNTLSGGENQRLKLAKVLLDQLQNKKGISPKMLILDEPSTGLHFQDISVLLEVFHELVNQGHSLLVIEHNVEVIKSADYVIDLGPEGGNEGGQIVAVGTPEDIIKQAKGYTYAFLDQAINHHAISLPKLAQISDDAESQVIPGYISLRGARHHNLKNVDLDVKRGEMTVLTGLSGSGKSSLAFDIFFAEGQRRFMDVMSPYARQFTEQLESPDIDRLTGLPPTVAIEQNVSRGGTKSTVGTVTEIWQFLRLLYAKLGQAYCPNCQIPVGKRSEAEVVQLVLQSLAKNSRLMLMAPLVRNRKGHYADLVRWAEHRGYDAFWIDGAYTKIDDFKPLDRYSNHDLDLVTAYLTKDMSAQEVEARVKDALKLGEGFIQIAKVASSTPELIGTKLACPSCGTSFQELEPSTFSYNSPRGWCQHCKGHGITAKVKMKEEKANSLLEAEMVYDKDLEKMMDDEAEFEVCPECEGVRLNAFARSVQVQGFTPGVLSSLSALDAAKLIASWQFVGQDALIARDVVSEVVQRLEFLHHVGLGYLSLDRSATTLSGGETQRIRLAAQLGSHLRGVLYILDEPTIGLHPSDNERLLGALNQLKDRGNTLLVVEHDEETMKQADRIVDLGPGAGINGGQIVADGTFDEIAEIPDSVTGLALHEKPKHPYFGKRRPIPRKKDQDAWLSISGCTLNNLKNIDVAVPKGRLTVVTGVSGAGKTSLITGTMRLVAKEAKGDHITASDRACWKSSSGFDSMRMIYEVDQKPIGKTPRSTPSTYMGIMDDIRTLFAQTADAKRLGYDRGRFSFNTSQGNCEACKGTGMQKLEMDFLPPCYVLCETCRGKRYNSGTLMARYKGKTIADVLQMDFTEASEFFSSQPRIAEPLQLLSETGLGYLTLGQASNTLSGGEAQRLKLVTELIKGQRVVRQSLLKGKPLPSDLYLIEEPSIGLHPQDVRRLIDVLYRLVNQGHTVVVIEHNTEIMAEADYIIDMGPGPGEEGGRIVISGTPEKVAKGKSITAPYILQELES